MTDSGDDPTRVAIACQGGGSHTAFTAGVLTGLFEAWDDRFELVGISGTSGGAFNAVAAWYGLVTDGPDRAIELLEAVWSDLAADGWRDRLTNQWVTGIARLESMGLPVPTVSPYQSSGDEAGKRRIVETLERHIDFAAVQERCLDPATTPELVVGTVDVNGGHFETFTNEGVTPEAVLASAAVPNLFEAVEIDGHYHWDGLFSQNPPIDDLFAVSPARKPEELWVVQINPQTFEGEPTTVDVIADRRNELAGNISLNQELRFVDRVNDWVDAGYLPEDRFGHVDVHRIEMGRPYHAATKVDRDPDFLDELTNLGRTRADEFLDARE